MKQLLGEDTNLIVENAEYTQNVFNTNCIPEYVEPSEERDWLELQEQIKLLQQERNNRNNVSNYITKNSNNWKKALCLHGLYLSNHIHQEYNQYNNLSSSLRQSETILDSCIGPYRYYKDGVINNTSYNNTKPTITSLRSILYKEDTYPDNTDKYRHVTTKNNSNILEETYLTSSSNSYIVEEEQALVMPIIVATPISLLSKVGKSCLGAGIVIIGSLGLYSGYKWLVNQINQPKMVSDTPNAAMLIGEKSGASDPRLAMLSLETEVENQPGSNVAKVTFDDFQYDGIVHHDSKLELKDPRIWKLINGEKHLGSPSKYDVGIRNLDADTYVIDGKDMIIADEQTTIPIVLKDLEYEMLISKDSKLQLQKISTLKINKNFYNNYLYPYMLNALTTSEGNISKFKEILVGSIIYDLDQLYSVESFINIGGTSVTNTLIDFLHLFTHECKQTSKLKDCSEVLFARHKAICLKMDMQLDYYKWVKRILQALSITTPDNINSDFQYMRLSHCINESLKNVITQFTEQNMPRIGLQSILSDLHQCYLTLQNLLLDSEYNNFTLAAWDYIRSVSADHAWNLENQRQYSHLALYCFLVAPSKERVLYSSATNGSIQHDAGKPYILYDRVVYEDQDDIILFSSLSQHYTWSEINGYFEYDVLHIKNNIAADNLIQELHLLFLADNLVYYYSPQQTSFFNMLYYYLIAQIIYYEPEQVEHHKVTNAIKCIMSLLAEGVQNYSYPEVDYLSIIFQDVILFNKAFPSYKYLKQSFQVTNHTSFFIANAEDALVILQGKGLYTTIFSFRYGTTHQITQEYMFQILQKQFMKNDNLYVLYLTVPQSSYNRILYNEGCDYYSDIVGQVNFLIDPKAIDKNTRTLNLTAYNLHDIDINKLTLNIKSSAINHLILDYNILTVVGLNTMFNSGKFYSLKSLSLLRIHGLEANKINFTAVDRNLPQLQEIFLDSVVNLNPSIAFNIRNVQLRASIFSYKDAITAVTDDMMNYLNRIENSISSPALFIHRHHLIKNAHEFNEDIYNSRLIKVQILYSVHTFYHSCILNNLGCGVMLLSGAYSIMSNSFAPYTKAGIAKLEQKVLNSLRLFESARMIHTGVGHAPDTINKYLFNAAIKIPVVGIVTSLPDVYQAAVSIAFLSNCDNDIGICNPFDIASNTVTVFVSAGSISANIFFFLKNVKPLYITCFSVGIEVALKLYQIVESNLKIGRYITLKMRDIWDISRSTLIDNYINYEYSRLSVYDDFLHKILNNTRDMMNSDSNIALVISSISGLRLHHARKIPNSIFNISFGQTEWSVAPSTAHIRIDYGTPSSLTNNRIDRIVEMIKGDIPKNLKIVCGPIADTLNQNGFTTIDSIEFYCQNAIAFANIKEYDKKAPNSHIIYVMRNVNSAFINAVDFGINIFYLYRGQYLIYARNSTANFYVLQDININGIIYLGQAGGTNNILIVNDVQKTKDTLDTHQIQYIYLGTPAPQFKDAYNNEYRIEVVETMMHNVTVRGSRERAERIICNIDEFDMNQNNYFVTSQGSIIPNMPDVIVDCPLVVLAPGMSCLNHLEDVQFILDEKQMSEDFTCENCNANIDILNYHDANSLIIAKNWSISQIEHISYDSQSNDLSMTLSCGSNVQKLTLHEYFHTDNMTTYTIIFNDTVLQPNIYDGQETIKRIGISRYSIGSECDNIINYFKSYEELFTELSVDTKLNVDGSFVVQCPNDWQITMQYGTNQADTFLMNYLYHAVKGFNNTDYYILVCTAYAEVYIDNFAEDRVTDEIIILCNTEILFLLDGSHLIIELPSYSSTINVLNYVRGKDYQHIIVTTHDHYFFVPLLQDGAVYQVPLLKPTKFHSEYQLTGIQPRTEGVQASIMLYCTEDSIHRYLEHNNMILYCHYKDYFEIPLIVIFQDYVNNYKIVREYDFMLYNTDIEHQVYDLLPEPDFIGNIYDILNNSLVQQVAINNSHVMGNNEVHKTRHFSTDYKKYFDITHSIIEFTDNNIVSHLVVKSNTTHSVIGVNYFSIDQSRVHMYLQELVSLALGVMVYKIYHNFFEGIEDQDKCTFYRGLLIDYYLSASPNALDARVNNILLGIDDVIANNFVSPPLVKKLVHQIIQAIYNYNHMESDKYIEHLQYPGMLHEAKQKFYHNLPPDISASDIASIYNEINDIEYIIDDYVSHKISYKELTSILLDQSYTFIFHDDIVGTVHIVYNANDNLTEKIERTLKYLNNRLILDTNKCFRYDTYRYMLVLLNPIIDQDVGLMLDFYNLYEIPLLITNYSLSEVELQYFLQCIQDNEDILERFKDYLRDKSYVMSLNTTHYIDFINKELFSAA